MRAAASNYALRFDGVNDYATLGNPSALGLSKFTVELWFRRDGTGVTTSTGTGGLTAVPLVTKGRSEVDGSNKDMNYFLGLQGTSPVLVADFEDTASGANHPVIGKTCVCDANWHHAAATYDGTTWRLYLDGVLDTMLAVGAFTPRSDSIQWAAIGSAQNSSGTAAGFFKGAVDEIRIWNSARSASAIQTNRNVPIPSQSGLVGRWGLEEGTGTSAADSSGKGVTGTLKNGPAWIAGAPLTGATSNQAPSVNAGPDLSITLPGTVNLAGQTTDDGLPTGTLTVNWSKVSGPGTVTFGSTTAASTTAAFSAAGSYVLRLTATDGPLSSSDTATVQVNAAAVNKAPTVNAGPDASVTQPGPLTLNGIVIDDGLPAGKVTTGWSQTSGPGVVAFGNTAAASTTATFPQAGTYVLSLTATDGSLSASDSVTVTVNAQASSNTALKLPGSSAYVTFGPAAALGAGQFTLEAWFEQLGTGQTTSTGTGGVTAVPLISKGRSESDASNKDMNYFLGIDGSGHLVADFEEGAAGQTPGLNHPVVGSTTFALNTWYHVAATYDGVTWRLYVNGQLDGQLAVNRPPRADSIQHAGIGAALSSTGAASGFFSGVIDEVRIWNAARTPQDIVARMNTAVVSAPNLVGRWGLNDGAGTSAIDSSGSGVNGTIVGTGSAWVPGAPFSANTPPDQPILSGPGNGTTPVGTPLLNVLASDPDQDKVTVTFFGRATPAATPDFTLVAIPDTQHYVDSANYPIFTAQTQWIVANSNTLNIAFVTHLGDIAQNIDAVEQEWQRADTSMKVLDNAGIPYAVSPGNHDISPAGVAKFYDQYFPVSRFLPQPTYTGWLGKESSEVDRQNKDNYELFSVGSLDFLAVHLEMDIPDYSLAWADKILKRYPNRRAIISTHIYLNVSGVRPTSPQFRSNGTSAEQVWQQLIAPNCNVFLVVNGHYHGEARRTDLNNCGQPVHQIVQDYQDDANGGDGWLRYFIFKPSTNKIQAYTYSPTRNSGLGEYDADAQSQFTLDYAMQGTPFGTLGSTAQLASGSSASVPWAGLAPKTPYEWYVTVSDGKTTTVGPSWTFTTP